MLPSAGCRAPLGPVRHASPLGILKSRTGRLREKKALRYSYPTKTAGLRVVDPRPADRDFVVYTRKDIDSIPQLQRLADADRTAMKAVSAVLPFRVNKYVLDSLIDWDRIPEDPIYRLTFPHPDMLSPRDFRRMFELVKRGAAAAELKAAAGSIQRRLNPHPGGQRELNIPSAGGESIEGIQHKYRETVLFFPSAGQTCHTYCAYCFRWAQFVGIDALKFASRQVDELVSYLHAHREVTSVLLTGGDPLVMKTAVLRRFVEPLLSPELGHIRSIRIGTKAPAYWPQRFVTDADSDDLLRLFEQVQGAGRHLALMAHYSHPRELGTPVAHEALRRIRMSGAVVRCQAPLIRHVNDTPDAWARLWGLQVKLGAVPYYMFVERDTGPKSYFEVPLARALDIFNEAQATVSGLARTARGPVMSATPGKVLIDGVADVGDARVFVLKFLQARDPQWVGRTFFARFDPQATWLDHLRPAQGRAEFFFEQGLRDLVVGQSSVTTTGADDQD